jgi:hypothetical protein
MANKYSEDRWSSGSHANAADRTADPSVRITQQFRERRNMTYELDCSGVPLVLRIFFPENAPDASWRIEACTGNTVPASSVSASASSKALALQGIAQNWREAMPRSVLDWDGVAKAMTSVRAL